MMNLVILNSKFFIRFYAKPEVVHGIIHAFSQIFDQKNKSFDRNWPENNHFKLLFITFKYSECQFVVKNDIFNSFVA